MGLDSFDMDLDLGGLSLDDSGGGLTIEEVKQGLYEELGLGDIEFDTSEGVDFDITDGTEFFLDFDEEDSDLGSAAEVLRSYADISVDLIPYWQYANNALQKLFAEDNVDLISRSMPAIAEFNYIPDVTRRQQVYGFFCQTLDDLTTDPRYVNLNEDEAFKLMVDELYAELHWTPNVNVSRLRSTFTAYYEDNKKLSTAKHVDKNSISTLLDRQALELSEMVFRINSVPFNLLTKFFNDPSLINIGLRMDTSILGGLAEELRSRQGVRKLTHSGAFSGIITFLTSEETMNLLGLSIADVNNYSIGELFRRYILFELNDGTFYPQGLMKLPSPNFTEDLAAQLVMTLYSSVQKQSFAAELIFITLDLMKHAGEGVMKPSQRRYTYKEYFQQFCVGIAQYLSAFTNDKALCNPVFYTLIDTETAQNGDSSFTLTYTEGDDVFTASTPGILCEVVGDNSNIYHIPLVYVGPKSHSVLCPPKEVVEGVRRATTSGRISIAGAIHYRYTPTYNWLSTLNITATGKKVKEDNTDISSGHVNNPLLAMLLSYNNRFDMSGEAPEVVAIHSAGIQQLLGVRRSKTDSITISRMLLTDGGQAVSSGVLAMDEESGGIVISYVDPVTADNAVILLDDGDYEEDITSSFEEKNPCGFMDNFFKSMPQSGDGQPFLCATVRRLCALTSLDYDALLMDSREAIVRNLDFVIQSSCIDQLLGYRLFWMYLDVVQRNGGKLSDFNFTTLKEVASFVLGEGHPFAAMEHFDSSCVGILEGFCAKADAETKAIVNRFSNIDVHLLAMQALSRGEVGSTGEMRMYSAIHCIPTIHRKLRELEDKMVLLQVLHEVGDDIVPVFMKRSALNNVYGGICTRDNVAGLEKSLTSALKQSSPVELRATKAVLNATSIEGVSLLKYFILTQDAYGVLSTVAELQKTVDNADEELAMFVAFCGNLKNSLGFDDSFDIEATTEADFRKLFTRRQVEVAFSENYAEALACLYGGLSSEIGRQIDLRVIKAYDILDRFGMLLFNFTDSNIEDFSDTAEFQSEFMSYVGSFLVSFCPVEGEAADALDGGIDRVSAYIQHRLDYFPSDVLAELEMYDLVDLHFVEGADGNDALDV